MEDTLWWFALCHTCKWVAPLTSDGGMDLEDLTSDDPGSYVGSLNICPTCDGLVLLFQHKPHPMIIDGKDYRRRGTMHGWNVLIEEDSNSYDDIIVSHTHTENDIEYWLK